MKNLWCLLLLDDSLVMERKREITHIHTYTEKEVEGGGEAETEREYHSHSCIQLATLRAKSKSYLKNIM